MARIEWRFTEGSALSVGHWYYEWGDVENESLLTLAEVMRVSDNPVWCLREHVRVLSQINDATLVLVGDITEALPLQESGGRVSHDSPLARSLAGAHQALHHAVALLIDALVECRKGRLEAGLRDDAELASATAFAIADALNSTHVLEQLLIREPEL